MPAKNNVGRPRQLAGTERPLWVTLTPEMRQWLRVRAATGAMSSAEYVRRLVAYAKSKDLRFST